MCQFLSGNNVQCRVHILLVSLRRNAVSYLAASCPIKQHNGRYSQSAARVLKTRCGGAPQPRKCQWREIQSVQFDSGTVPHQLENNSQTIVRAKQRFPFKKQENTEAARTNCSITRRRHVAKRLLRKQEAHAWNELLPHAKTVACKASASAAAPASPTLLLLRYTSVREVFAL